MASVFSEKERAHMEAHQAGVIAVVSPRGRLHQSVVRYVLDGDDVCISTEGKRTKARHAAAGGEVRFTVQAATSPYAAVTVIGKGEVQRTGVAEPTRRIMAQMGMDKLRTDDELAAVDRVILRIHPERVQSAWV